MSETSGNARRAFTAKQWQNILGEGYSYSVGNVTWPCGSRGNVLQAYPGCSGTLLLHGELVSATIDQCQGLAALALHGQPFGFTHADVALLRGYAAWFKSEDPDSPRREEFASLAARIAALLPPEGTHGE